MRMENRFKRKDKFLIVLVIMTLFLALAMAVLLYSVNDLRQQRVELMEKELQLKQQQIEAEKEYRESTAVVAVDDETSTVIEIADVPEDAKTEVYTCVARSYARCYQYPDTASAVIFKYKNRDDVEVVREENGFYLCKLEDGSYGYVERRFLRQDGEYIHVPGAKDLREYIPYAEFDILFASPNNITGHAMYPAVPILEDKTAEMLREAAEIFARDGYTIKIYDAYRPKSAQFELYDIVQDVRYIANPYTSCSWHQRGRAVDMSLVNTRTGVELEMPTSMHTFDATASRFNSGIWTDAAKANVAYMTDVMTSVGFETLSTEWWHFENTGTGGYLDVDIDLGDPAYYD